VVDAAHLLLLSADAALPSSSAKKSTLAIKVFQEHDDFSNFIMSSSSLFLVVRKMPGLLLEERIKKS
jgi:hypothetical protein